MGKIRALISRYIKQRIDIRVSKCFKLAAGKLYLEPSKTCCYRNFLINSMITCSSKLRFIEALDLSTKSYPQKISVLSRFLNPLTFMLFLLSGFRFAMAALIDTLTHPINTDAATNNTLTMPHSSLLGSLLKCPLCLLFVIELPLTWLVEFTFITRRVDVEHVDLDHMILTEPVDLLQSENDEKPEMTLAVAAQLEYQLDYQPLLQVHVQKLTARAQKIKETIHTLGQFNDMQSTETYKKLQNDMQETLDELMHIQLSHEDYAFQQTDMIVAPINRRNDNHIVH